jgi:patatin-like phospholipase/acyl hydrolase
MAEKRFILSIDGGGIRGLIPAIVLAEIEKRLASAGKGKPLAQHFDMIAGTSTGGIIAAGLACPKGKTKSTPACTAKDLVKLYEEEGKDIFPNSVFSRLRAALFNPGALFEERYDVRPLEEKLQARLGDRSVSEAITLVVLTGYDITQRKAVFITNGVGSDDEPSDDYLFWQAARATSAAPTYFEPALIFNFTKMQNEALIDGGVFANDPTLAAVIEAKKQGWDEGDMRILSLGTGQNNRPYTFAETRHWGALAWISPARGAPIISILMQGQASTVSYQMERLFGVRYTRIDGPLDVASDDLDDASASNIADLRTQAEKFIETHSEKIDAFLEML